MTGYSWDVAVSPYLGTKADNFTTKGSFFQCPSDPNRATGRSYAVPRPSNHDIGPTKSVGSTSTRVYVPLAGFEAVSETLMLAEKPGSNVWDPFGADVRCPGTAGVKGGGNCASGAGQSQQATIFGVDLTEPLHLEGWNYLYMDGHVKWATPASTIGTGYKTATRKGSRTIGVGQGVNIFGVEYNCAADFPCGPWTRDPMD